MQANITELLAGEAAQPRPISWPRARALRLASLTALILLAAGLRLANLQSLGYANHYYTAAVARMLQSWHNFFFVAAEPGGSGSVGQAPAGPVVQAPAAF